MKVIKQNSKRLNILANGGSQPSREALAEWLKLWRQKLGYFSVFAALPTVFASQAQEALADEVNQPQPSVAGPTAKFADKIGSCSSQPDFLKRQSEYRLPHQKGSFDILRVLGGNDDCPGRTIPAGTYTAAAPFIDAGDTTGANNTVNRFYCYFCWYSTWDTPGPDQVYTFRVTDIGPKPQIQVTATSAGYDPAIYILSDDGFTDVCPNGTNNFSSSGLFYHPTSGATETIHLGSYPFWIGVPLHLFVDSAVSGANSAGGYSIRMQDVTIAPVVLSEPRFDFDGDGRADISVFRPSDRTWYLNRSFQGFSATPYGLSTDKIVPLKFNNDRRTDLAVFRDGTWWLQYNFYNGYWNAPAVQFGLPNDIPVPADYDGDGRADISVFRPSDGTWYRQNSSNGQFGAVQFGQNGDVPMLGDYDADGKTDFTVFRPSNGYWYIYRSSDNQVQFDAFGLSGDIPLNGDFNGDGRSDLAVFRPSDGTWYVARPTGIPAQNFDATQFGLSTDIPTPDDYDGDGKTDIAIYRDGVWYLLQSTNGFEAQQFGLANDKPVPAAYLP